MSQVAIVVGSLRKESFNRKLAYALNKLNHTNLSFNILKIDDIPLYNQDLDNDLPASVVRMKKEVAESDAILFVTPEYNRSIPGVLKNIIDWGTRPYGKNVWADKLIGMLGTSPGVIGTAVAQSHLRSILVSIGAVVMGQPEVYVVYKEGLVDDEGMITVDQTKKFLQTFLDKFSEEIKVK